MEDQWSAQLAEASARVNEQLEALERVGLIYIGDFSLGKD